MHNRLIPMLGAVLLAGALFVPASPGADGTKAAPAADKAPAAPDEPSIVDGADDLDEQLQDTAFDGYVYLGLLGAALTRGDPVLLTDVALGLAEGERVLMRPHVGVTAESVMRLAADAAVSRGDAASLDRLAKGARAFEMADVARRIESKRKLLSGGREAGPALRADADETPAQVFAILRDYQDQIRAARVLGDRNTLDALEAGLGTGLALPDAQKARLAGLIADARNAAPEKPAPDAGLLARLADATRGEEDNEDEKALPPQVVSGAFLVSPRTVNTNRLPARNRAVFAYCERRVGKRVGSGQCADLAQKAIEAAIRRPFLVTGPENARGDYIWGVEVAEISPRSRGVRRLEPGDVL